MKKYLLIGGIILIAIVAIGYIGFTTLGINQQYDFQDVDYNDMDIYNELTAIVDKDIEYSKLQGYIRNLNIKMSWVDGEDYISVIDTYKTNCEADGLILVKEGTYNGAKLVAYRNWLYTDIKGVIAKTDMTHGHTTTVFTGHGFSLTWLEFYNWLNS